ncbi:MAG: hypothetical protein ACFE85_17200 [Candidatus Hodarchaeota archaeon]
MKNIKLKISIIFIALALLATIQPTFAANQYAVKVGARFRWDATKYIYIKDGMGPGNNLEYTHNYYFEFNFTDWGNITGLEYVNGIADNNGTIGAYEISHEYYYGRSPVLTWVTSILDTSGPYPVYIYLVCDTEIEQSTKPSLQTLASNSWLTFGESSTYTFTLTGTFVDDDVTTYYTGNIEFNSDKVLKYVKDEIINENNTISQTLSIERYIWSLTYTPGTDNGIPGDGIPGFSIYLILASMLIGFLFIIRRKNLFRIREI